MSPILDLAGGVAYVVTDLHGEAQPYLRYRDSFLALKEQGRADILVFLGDIIHGYGAPEQDASLDIALDIMRLRAQLGKNAVVMAIGNHELPHIYGVTLSKGTMEFTSRFEAALGEHRAEIIDFFKSLPFMIRTPGGVLLTHAGAAQSVATEQAAQLLQNYSHDSILAEADQLMNREDVIDLMRTFMNMTVSDYDQAAKFHLAVSGQSDPRYFDLLRGLIVSNLKEWQVVWDLLFNQCESGLTISFYRQVMARFLALLSPPERPLRVMATGHMAVRNGYEVIADRQLRFASWAHSAPKEAGKCLLFDTSRPFETAHELAACLHHIP